MFCARSRRVGVGRREPSNLGKQPGGVLLGEERQRRETVGNLVGEPVVAVDGASGVLACWMDRRCDLICSCCGFCGRECGRGCL